MAHAYPKWRTANRPKVCADSLTKIGHLIGAFQDERTTHSGAYIEMMVQACQTIINTEVCLPDHLVLQTDNMTGWNNLEQDLSLASFQQRSCRPSIVCYSKSFIYGHGHTWVRF